MADSARSFNDIAPTAFLPAYWRQYSDPVELAEALYSTAYNQWFMAGHPMPKIDKSQTYHGPTMEARQLAGNILLKRVNARQVLELAAGFSPQGYQQTQDNPDIRCVEVDLPRVSQIKRQTLQLIGSSALNKRLHLVPGSALDPAVIGQAAAYFDPYAPVFVKSEGFLHYLDNDQRAEVAALVTGVLRRFGGAWITDLPHHPDAQAAQAPAFSPAGTGRDVAALAFVDRTQALQFFANQGFVESDVVEYADLVDQLVSTERVGLSREVVAAQQKPWGMHVLRLAA